MTGSRTLAAAAAVTFAALLAVPAPAGAADILVADLSEIIQPVTAQYLINTMDRAEEEGAALLVVRLNTPGGVLDSTNEIIMRMLDTKSRVPVAVLVSPSGARAASAGFLITITADIAAMSPGTNMGAAHPVGGVGEKLDEIMTKKVANDMVARIKSIVEKRGRNVDMAEKGIRESSSYTEQEALQGHLIEYVCKDVDDLIAQLNGKTVRRFDGMEITLRLAGLPQRWVPMSQKEKLLNLLAHPTVAYLLFMAALLGFYFEFANPGAIFPGVAGGICLILALFAFSVLPINYAGLALILLSFGFFIAEVKVQSFGVLGIGGVISLVLGSMMLIDAPDASLRPPLQLILFVSLGFAAIVIFLLRLAVKAMRSRKVTGEQGIIGEVGEVMSSVQPKGTYPIGKVRVRGEYWNAVSAEQEIRQGEPVVVVEISGLLLTVKRPSQVS